MTNIRYVFSSDVLHVQRLMNIKQEIDEQLHVKALTDDHVRWELDEQLQINTLYDLHDIKKSREQMCSLDPKRSPEQKGLDGSIDMMILAEKRKKKLKLHNKKIDGSYDFRCKFCHQKFRYRTLWKFHVAKHTGDLAYKCRKCYKQFATAAECDRHDRETHKRFMCGECGYKAKSATTLNIHIRIHNKEDKLNVRDKSWKQKYSKSSQPPKPAQLPKPYNFMCEVFGCGQKFKTKGLLGYHTGMHTGELPFKCKRCSRRFAKEAEMLAHESRVHPQYICEICGYDAKKKWGLERHLETHLDKSQRAPQPPKKVYTYFCDVCGISKKSPGELKYHMATHTGELPYKCTKCNKRYTTTQERDDHQAEHHKRYPCEFCGRVLISNKGLTGHIMAIHTKEKPFGCGQCERRFISQSFLNYHLRNAHLPSGDGDNVKPIMECKVCGKKYKSLQGLLFHEKGHLGGVRQFECDLCDKKCTSKSLLSSHVKHVHNNARPHQCKFCGKGFKTKFGLGEHERRHTGEKPFQCTFCEKRFVAKATLRDHTRVHTGEKPYKCKYCDKAFALSNNKNTHEKTHTGEKPHKCELCGAGFVRADFLKKHHSSIHCITDNVFQTKH